MTAFEFIIAFLVIYYPTLSLTGST